MSKQSTRRALASATVLALSVATVWGLAAGWTASLIEGWFREPVTRYEQIHIAADGTPLIAIRDYRDWQNVDYQTLDRQPVAIEVESGLNGTSLLRPYEPPAIFAEPTTWQNRIGGMPNYSKPYASWYAIRDAERPGHAYFVAYEPVTNRPIAYAGRSGVSITKPEVEDWFEIGEHSGLSHAITSSGYFQAYGQYVYNQGVATDEGSIARWMAYIKDGDQLIELDTRNKRQRTVTEVNGLLSVSILSEPLAKKDASDEEANSDDEEGTAAPAGFGVFRPVAFNQDILSLGGGTITFSLATTVDSKRKTRQRLAAVGLDEILLIDPKTDTVDRFTIPASLRDTKDLTAYSIGDGALLLHTSLWNQKEPGKVALYWTNAAGEITREQTVQLATYNSGAPDWKTAFAGAGFVPVPVGWLVGGTLIAPLVLVNEREAETIGEAFSIVVEFGWPAFTAVIVLGLALAAFTWWKHRRLYRPGAALWAGLVLLFGPAGLIAYALHWRRPPIDHCLACDRDVPRDREHCPACGAEWAEPERIGIELFA